MGSPAASVVANVFMGALEQKALRSALYKKRIAPRMNELLGLLSKQNDEIRLTREGEKNSRLPFLDVNAERRERFFRTSVYRKKKHTHANRVLSFKAHHSAS